ncbi:U3 snoRNP protein [Tilletia horrida]|uniref:U3 snoRNP protein n=1 Tax=Tilletia horrida TaxID=155126 RepID=A0AAN6GNG4_9BASI|nr:U3 snoRNP protein [Tilletia horrida]KAK0549661.1 U3 snoRNP protein [Tilletia horrida]KAK0564803.1 U3 snoRNP protein [Tilletia horrida]
MERVQYSLERTLPSLHALDSTNTFSREELRALTAQRASLETALVRRIANRDGSDYIAYVAFEDKIEKLRLVRTAKAEAEAHSQRKTSNKLGKQGAADELTVGGTKEQQARLRASYLARCISIFERGVTKLKDSLPLWQSYLAWARARNMRIVVGRIFARVLNLHTANIPLWIQAAGYELGTNFAANTARLLLQRAISLNTLPFNEVAVPIENGSETALSNGEEQEERPKKKRRQSKSSTSSSRQIAAAAPLTQTQTRPISFTFNLTPAERDLVRLWVEYARMELVFLERLRRRWAVLGLAEGSKSATAQPSSKARGISQRFTKQGQQSSSITDAVDTSTLANLPGDHPEGVDDEADEDVPLSGDQDQRRRDEEEAVRSSNLPDAEVQNDSPAPNVAQALHTPAQVAQQAIMSGGLLTPLIKTAFTSVAPKLRMVLALGLIRLLRAFPLLDTADESRDVPSATESIRKALAEQVLDTFANSSYVGPNGTPLLSPSQGAARAILLAARPILLDSPSSLSRLSRSAREEERETNIRLRVQGKLRSVEDDEVDGMLKHVKADFKAREAKEKGSISALPSFSTLSKVPRDPAAHFVALEIVQALRPLAQSASSRAQVPILLGQFIGQLLEMAAATRSDAAGGKKTETSSSMMTAYYGLSLSLEGESARFPALAAQVLTTIVGAELRRPTKKAVAVSKDGDVDSDEGSDEGEERDDQVQSAAPASVMLIQEQNLRLLLQKSAERLISVPK